MVQWKSDGLKGLTVGVRGQVVVCLLFSSGSWYVKDNGYAGEWNQEWKTISC